MKRLTLALALAFATPASAADQIKATIGQRGNWDTAVIHLGTKAGIFAKHNIEVEPTYTSGSGETLQPVISGSVDLGFAVGTLGAMAAYAKGAPVRIIGAQATGAADYWYAKSSSPIKTLKDTTDKTTIAFSTRGSSTNSIVLAFVKEFDLKAKPTPTGNPSSTLTAVMTDQVDIGWASPPFGLREMEAGQDPRRRARDRCLDREGPDHPRDRGECRCAGEAQGCDRALHDRLSRGDRIHVFGRSAGHQGLCRVRERTGAAGEARARRIFPEVAGMAGRDQGPRHADARGGVAQIHRRAADAGAARRTDPDSGRKNERTRQTRSPHAAAEPRLLLRRRVACAEVRPRRRYDQSRHRRVARQGGGRRRADVDAAVAAAKAAFKEWRNVLPLERAKMLRRIAEVLRKHAQELAMIDAADCGNPVAEMVSDALIAAAQTEFFAGLVTEMKGSSIPMGPDAVNFSVREPRGVVARIIPFNHPFMFCAGKSAAPLAAGNTVIVKPPEQSPLSSLRLAELIDGILPPGVFNVVPGGKEVGAALAEPSGRRDGGADRQRADGPRRDACGLRHAQARDARTRRQERADRLSGRRSRTRSRAR